MCWKCVWSPIQQALRRGQYRSLGWNKMHWRTSGWAKLMIAENGILTGFVTIGCNYYEPTEETAAQLFPHAIVLEDFGRWFSERPISREISKGISLQSYAKYMLLEKVPSILNLVSFISIASRAVPLLTTVDYKQVIHQGRPCRTGSLTLSPLMMDKLKCIDSRMEGGLSMLCFRIGLLCRYLSQCITFYW